MQVNRQIHLLKIKEILHSNLANMQGLACQLAIFSSALEIPAQKLYREGVRHSTEIAAVILRAA
jgi:hypothetical protein